MKIYRKSIKENYRKTIGAIIGKQQENYRKAIRKRNKENNGKKKQ